MSEYCWAVVQCIVSLGQTKAPVGIFTYKFSIQNQSKFIGKYTVRPMDGMGTETHTYTPQSLT